MTLGTNANTKPGCVGGLLRMIGLGSHDPVQTLPPIPEPSVSADELPADTMHAAEPLPYRVRDNFLSPAELSFYHVLQLAVHEQATIQAKVGLAEIFFVARPHENQASRARIVQKHIDFLLCDPKTMRPLVGIELDDASHEREDRQERDTFVNEVFEATGLPLVRYKVQFTYHTGELAATLAPYLAPSSGPAVQPPLDLNATTSQGVESPLCPKCGIPMVLRTAARGDHRGESFYGCRNYPDCRAMLPYQPPVAPVL